MVFSAFFTPVRSFDIYGEFPVFIVNARSVVVDKSSLAELGVVFSSTFSIDGNITECIRRHEERPKSYLLGSFVLLT